MLSYLDGLRGDRELFPDWTADRLRAAIAASPPVSGVVAIRMSSTVDSVVELLAALASGATALLVSGDAPQPEVDGLRRQAVASGPHVLIPTSGTTGDPKLVLRDQASLAAEALGYRERFALGEQDTLLIPVPLSHAYALSWLACTIVTGIRTVLCPPNAMGAIESALDGECTVVALTPALTRLLLLRAEPARAGRRLRLAVIGAGPVDQSLASDFQRVYGIGLGRIYGSTETGAMFAGLADLPPMCAGTAMPGVEHRLVDGCLEVRMAPGQDWHQTNDLVELDHTGQLTVLGRRTAAIRRGDRWVAPLEIEAALREHPAVAEACIDAQVRSGDAHLTAFVEVTGGAVSAADLARFLRERLAPYKVPNDIKLFDRLARTASGKVLPRPHTEGD